MVQKLTRQLTIFEQDRTRTVLTMDDLSAALSEYGINARRADFFR